MFVKRRFHCHVCTNLLPFSLCYSFALYPRIREIRIGYGSEVVSWALFVGVFYCLLQLKCTNFSAFSFFLCLDVSLRCFLWFRHAYLSISIPGLKLRSSGICFGTLCWSYGGTIAASELHRLVSEELQELHVGLASDLWLTPSSQCEEAAWGWWSWQSQTRQEWVFTFFFI